MKCLENLSGGSCFVRCRHTLWSW